MSALGDLPQQAITQPMQAISGAPGRDGGPDRDGGPGRRPRLLWLWSALGGLGAALVLWIILGAGVQVAYAGKIMPGTHVGAVDVGGLAPAVAHERLVSTTRSGIAVTLTHSDQQFPVRAGKVGYQLDQGATLRKATAVRRQNPLTGIWFGPAALWVDHEIRPVDKVDQRRLERRIAGVAKRVDQRPFFGALSITADGTKVRAVPPRVGREVDRETAEAATLANLRQLRPSRVRLPVRQTGVDPQAVQAVAGQAERYLETPLRLRGNGKTAKLGPRRLAPVLAVEPTREGSGWSVRLGVDDKKLSRLVDSLTDRVDREPVDAHIEAPAQPTVLDEKENLSWSPQDAQREVTPAKQGRVLHRKKAGRVIAAAVRDGSHAEKLPIRTARPKVPTKQAEKVTSLIGTFTTHFSCCEPRVQNIRQIAATVDGTVVMPGKRFSLNEVAGPRTVDKGYVPAPSILRGKLVPDVGGGVSQFSTTIYNAAYFAGLPIEAHMPHSFYISRYPPGRESTLDYPSVPLIWTNDTDAPVLVRTATTDTSVTVTLYGDNGGREVEAVHGEQEPWSGGDFQITVTRMITYPDGREIRQPYTTRYEKPPEDEDEDDNDN